MKIDGHIPKVSGVYNKLKNIGKVDSAYGVASKKDVISISSQAKDFQTVMKAVKDVPDMRTELVNELSTRYDSGSYDVSGKDVADKVMKSILDQKV